MHVTESDISSFRARQMPVAALVAFTDHLAGCDECRQRTAKAFDARQAEAVLSETLGVDADLHVPELEIHAFVDNQLDVARREEIAAHLESCPACAAEVRDLREFALAAATPTPRRVWAYALAAAAVLVIGIAFGFMTRTRPVSQVAVLEDAGGRVTLDVRGTLSGTGTLLPEERDRVRDALGNGRLYIPASVTALRGERGTLRGSTDAAIFRLSAPVGTVVLETLPTLRWTSAAGATNYIVTLQNEESGQTTSSPSVSDTFWKPDVGLARGGTYTWQVAARTGVSETIAPAPPAPPARFRVATAADAARLEALPPSHLVRGVAYAGAGLLDDAERELSALAAANPNSPLVEGLQRQLRAVRP